MPACVGAEPVFDIFYLSGMSMLSGGELSPLTWAELEAFNTANRLDLSVYLKNLLMKMSRVHVSSLAKHRAPKSKPPYVSQANPLAKRKRKLN